MELPTSYEPKEVENRWYDTWEKEGCFHADENDDKDPYSIVIPPPNVTGSLHMGHALNNTLQDILVRWQRMKGKSVLWMPGMDHAGIATQNVVERLLKEEGLTKNDLGREKFQERVWKWKAESGGTIKNQLKSLGCSLDWERERFTLDDGLSKAVHKVFATLYKEGLIYQGYRIINWCPRCETALSDIETEHQDLDGKLWHLKYKIADSDESIVVATTRPETMLGDSGIAVNPNDERSKHLIGKKVILPLVDREIPIFGDEYVDMEFGTGFVKVTPAHDPNDFEMGKRHDLEEIIIMDLKGKINGNGGKYNGMDRFEARKAIVQDLDELGLLVKIDHHEHSVGHCYRCQTIVEPALSKQWFVDIKPLASEAIKAVEEGSVKFVPKNWEKTYFEWMYNIRDWCISRQLWWGHRIPAFYCDDCGHVNVSEDDPTECEKCGCKNLTQDEDVLDTWFSSGLWPFSTMGWPEDGSNTLNKYYPTATLVTGFDIIFFWVARMIMMGKKFMGDVPFKDVYIHALVRDENGHKMSKSKGNVVDPLVMMDRYGTDAFRFTLAMLAAQGRDIILAEKRIDGNRSFTNKIWNATKYILMNLGEDFKETELNLAELKPFDKWILHKLNNTIEGVEKTLEEYRFNESAYLIYEFWWHEFCDWYLEMTKQRIYNSEIDSNSAETARQVLFYILKQTLKLMHPFMPFLTEEIWEKIKSQNEKMLIISSWPEVRSEFNYQFESDETELFKEIIYKIRNIRGELNLAPGKKANVVFKTSSKNIIELIERESLNIQALAKIEDIKIDGTYEPNKTDASAVMNDVEIYLPLEGLIDFEKEAERLNKEITKYKKEVERVEKKLSNENFVAKAPEDVIIKEKEKMTEFSEILSKLEDSLTNLGK